MKIKPRIQAKWNEALIFDKGGKGRRTYIPEKPDIPTSEIPENWKRKGKIKLPEVSELELVRHVIRLSQMSHSVDLGSYPLGSCTMKYNPKINERIARFNGFLNAHPELPEQFQQGTIEVSYRLQEALKALSGFHSVTIQTAGGAQGEYLGGLIIREYHKAKRMYNKNKIIIPDSAHGTNPASAVMAGFQTVKLPSNENGKVDLNALDEILDDTIAGIMLTNPNTLGIFETDIIEINKKIHSVGGLSYLDGANFNGILGVVLPADMGFDIMHINLHKTFTGPHGGGGPGSGPVAVTKNLAKYLPYPLANKASENKFFWDSSHKDTSVGRLHSYNGNFGINLRALAYIYRNGAEGLRSACFSAVLNANYLMKLITRIKGLALAKLKENTPCKHEFVVSSQKMLNDTGVSANDLAKSMLDYGIHSPTIYFPLTVKEAIMIEPTEGETLQELEKLYLVIKKIIEQAYENPEIVKDAPKFTSVGKIDELSLARKPVLSYKMKSD